MMRGGYKPRYRFDDAAYDRAKAAGTAQSADYLAGT